MIETSKEQRVSQPLRGHQSKVYSRNPIALFYLRILVYLVIYDPG